ncbi:alpha/beta fold hydrolase [Roseicyclus mahoneyensis]|uniref:Pimeloyl-ACP methyl ester carboxylesterase n=1 Tax=Roseicyclus mahoneyensis TaxID=164332 RepID=A0A316GES9_9RHOB|nr:alpha/beta hydrolase [Roseicyclus mahoneyensis]PWK59501.1 pimeloyl-ACP methyl ester carboxylesterase [Roseicyclus mahoneyensis]
MTGFAKVWGQGDEPALLLHCSLAHSGAWDGVASALSDRLRATAPDLVGHGRGPARDESRDYHDHCTEMALTHLPDRPCHLVGHSFGATVALRLALDHPGRVASLTLIEPVLFAAARGQPGWRRQREVDASLDAAFATGDPAAATRRFLSVWGDGPAFDSLTAKQRAYLQNRIWVVAASSAALHDDTAGLLPRLDRLTCPVLLIEGDRSPLVIAEIQTALAAAIQQARRVIISGAGHMAPITHPDAVASEFRHLLA